MRSHEPDIERAEVVRNSRRDSLAVRLARGQRDGERVQIIRQIDQGAEHLGRGREMRDRPLAQMDASFCCGAANCGEPRQGA